MGRQTDLRLLHTLLLPLVAAALLVGCAGGEEQPAAETSSEAAETEVSNEPRVFFVEPRDGDVIEPLVTLKFGAENFTIEPVGEGEVHEGAGHFHIGLDTECLPAGVVIPTADPWIHFGDGSAEIEMQLAPGEHRLCLQIGDGEHRTVEGMHELITVTVQEPETAPDED